MPAILVGLLASSAATAEPLSDALVRVYQTNPALNAQRAQLRATDENVPQALSGYRPQLAAGLSAGLTGVKNALPDASTQSALLRPWTAGVTLTQPLFNGFRTANSVRQAEAQVRSGREVLRNTEQTVFAAAVSAYMNVVTDQALVAAQRANVASLDATLESTRRSLQAGNVTPTDVAQAEARLSRGRADLNAAEVALAIDQANYSQVVGVAPGRLQMPPPPDQLLPRRHGDAVAIARRENPTVVGATFDVDVAQLAIRIAQAALMPSVSVQAAAARSVDTDTTLGTAATDQASVIGQAAAPIYDGGLAAAQVRQAKEALSQTRMVLDQVRRQSDAAVATAWATNEGAKTAITAGEAEVHASDLALQGVEKEQAAGQRTTLDVLNSQQDLTAARARLIAARRDRIVASYNLLAATGRLDHRHLMLKTPDYDPTTHYRQVRDAWYGLRTPDGR